MPTGYPGITHGLAGSYTRRGGGCRCPLCREAHRLEMRRYRRERSSRVRDEKGARRDGKSPGP